MNKNRNANKLICMTVVGLIMGVLPLLLFNRSDDNSTQNKTITKTVHYRFLIRNTSSQPVQNAVFYAQTPMQETGTQRCLTIEASHPYELISNKNDGQLAKFIFETFPPYASKTISIRASLTLDTLPNQIPEADPVQLTSALQNNGPQKKAMLELATSLKADTVKDTATNIFNWVSKNVKYTGYSSKAKGAKRTFIARQGDCTEFADLFVALASLADIPARRVSGYLSSGSGLLKPEAYHDWAEFYDDGVWHIADPQRKNFDARYTNYIAMQLTSPTPSTGPINGYRRFYIDGNGLKVKMDS